LTAAIRTLIVDDDGLTRVGVRTILESEPDIEVVGEAADAAQGCALAAELSPDVVLMDVRLPDFDGIEATRRIVEARGEDETPRVIVLTTFDVDEYVYRSLHAGASGFLLKRTRAEDLVEAVRTVAAGNALPTPDATTRLIAAFSGSGAAAARAPMVGSLTQRESHVLVLIARGLSNQEIATHLGVSIETVRTHVKHVYGKCGARDRAQAVIVAYESGLVSRF
jgi:DNA-binding NarL/FixJ family response regulator